MEKIEDMEIRNNHKSQKTVKTDKTVKTASAIFSESLKSLMPFFANNEKKGSRVKEGEAPTNLQLISFLSPTTVSTSSRKWAHIAAMVAMLLIIGVGDAFGETITTADLKFGTPAISENFEGCSVDSKTAKMAENATLSGYGIFTKGYNNSTSNTYAIESSTFSSKALKITMGSGKPCGVAATGSYASKGAWQIKILKTSKMYVGFYAENATSTVLAHANASIYLQCNNGAISLSNGSSLISVGSTDTEFIDISVVYNNTTEATEYGEEISLGAKRAHVYINGNCVMNGDAPKAFTIPGATLSSFRVYPIATSSYVAAVDDIKIYNTLPGPARTLSSIAVTTPPTKIAYVDGESFDPTGAVVTATYSDESTKDVTSQVAWSPETLSSIGSQTITATYKEESTTTSVTVYGVTITMVGEDDETTELSGAGIPSAPTRTGANISVDNSTLYGFKKWVISNATLGKAASTQGNTITNPTGAVMLKAVYNAPRTVTWMVNGEEYTPYTTTGEGTDGTSAVQHGKAWSTLTLPTDPAPADYCGQKFMGWTTTNIGSAGYDKEKDAGKIETLVLMTSENKSTMSSGAGKYINSNIVFYAVFADYAE